MEAMRPRDSLATSRPSREGSHVFVIFDEPHGFRGRRCAPARRSLCPLLPGLPAVDDPALLAGRLPGAGQRQWLHDLQASTCTTASRWGPNYQRPAAPVASDWIDGDDQRIRKQEDDLAHWWSVLNDPALDALVADAYRQNLTLRDAGFRVLQARAMLGISIGNFFPQTQYM